MALIVLPFTLGPLENNVYLLADPENGDAVVIDPSFDSQAVLDSIHQRGWRLQAVWLTHAHFDHMAGTLLLSQSANPPVPIGLHPADRPLYLSRGGADIFGIRIDLGPAPDLELFHGQTLAVGRFPIEVRHAPGHSPGHVIFYSSDSGSLFCGDVIFNGSIGRTDLAGGSYPKLLESIHSQVLTLPDETRIYPGHGPASTVGDEKRYNPFLA